MANSPLAPVTITDKNGVVTTRHKKVSAQPAAGRTIPAPTTRVKRSEDEVQSVITRLKVREGSMSTQSLRRIVSELSDSEYAKVNELFDVPFTNPTEKNDGRRWVVRTILEQSGDKGWRLDGALALGRGSSMYSVQHLPFINTLAKDDRFSRKIRNLGRSGPEIQKQICSVASAIAQIDREYKNHPKHRELLFNRSSFMSASPRGTLIFDDKQVVEALFDNPDKAGLIAKLYLERWSVDALDEIVNSPTAIAEGAL
jgi:hypothetical protein